MNSETKERLESRAQELKAEGRTSRSAFFVLRREFRSAEKCHILAALDELGRNAGLWSEANAPFYGFVEQGNGYPSRMIHSRRELEASVDPGADFGPWGDGS